MKSIKLNKKSLLKFMLPVLGLGVLATAVALPITSCSEDTTSNSVTATLSIQKEGNDIGSTEIAPETSLTVKVAFSEAVKAGAKVTATLKGANGSGSVVAIPSTSWDLALSLDETGKIGTASYVVPNVPDLRSISVTGIAVKFTPTADGASETTATINDLTIKVAAVSAPVVVNVNLSVQNSGSDIGATEIAPGTSLTVKVTFSHAVKDGAKVTATLKGLQSDGSSSVDISPASWDLPLALDGGKTTGTANYVVPNVSGLRKISVTGIAVKFTPAAEGSSEITKPISDLVINVSA